MLSGQQPLIFNISEHNLKNMRLNYWYFDFMLPVAMGYVYSKIGKLVCKLQTL